MTTPETIDRPMRILFALAYPGYLRYYDSTVELLAERGHEVHVCFEQPHKQAEGLEALRQASERISIGETPRIRPASDAIVRDLRRLADYCRYLDPKLRDARYLRERMAILLPPRFRWLGGVGGLPGPVARGLLRGLLMVEEGVPSYGVLEGFVRSVGPDVMVVSPLVAPASRQPDLVRAARALGVPTVLGVASWDHLSTKGPIRVMPDVVVLWNEVQRREAQELHGVAAERIEVTGAQPFDRWFERRPSTARAQFCARVGLPDGPFLLFVGSTASISAPEAELKFVREWIGAVRASGSARLGGLSVLVRPHPYNTGLWGEADLSDLGDVAVWPRGGANPVDEEDRAGYFDSMFHASAVVGINTSAMIESAIVGRPVFTVRSPRFSDSQAGTLHFHYLLPEHGGFVRVADTLSEHVAQLDEALADPEGTREQIDGFVRSFVRPHGLDRKATPIVVEAIERAAARGPTTPWTMPPSRYPIRAALAAIKLVQVLRDDGQRALAVKGTATPTRRSLEAAGRAVERAGVGAGARIRDVGSSNGSAPLESLASRLEHGGAEAGRRLQERGARAERELEARGRRMLNLAKRRSRERRGERRRDQQAAVLERWRPGGGASERQPADR